MVVARDETMGTSFERSADVGIAAIEARETAMVQAEYAISKRFPRVWRDVEYSMLEHCRRPRFAEVARYAKKVGTKKENGQWVDVFARGFSARFAESLAQEMRNIKRITEVTTEDELIRLVRFGVIDIQNNIPSYRTVAFAKAVEKRGKRKGNEWEPPEGREVISSRINSYGEPTFLVRATDDELRNKINAEESKTHRDMVLKLCPRDILETCEQIVLETLERLDQEDPTEAGKRIFFSFRKLGITAADLEQYIGRSSETFAAKDLQALRELGVAIRDGQTTFQEALAERYKTPESGATDSDKERDQQHSAKMAEQARVAAEVQQQKRDAATQTQKTQPVTEPAKSEPSRAVREPGDESESEEPQGLFQGNQTQGASRPPAFGNRKRVE